MKKIAFNLLVICATLFGATYEYQYDVVNQGGQVTQKEKDFFMYGDFQRVIRYEPLLATQEGILEESEATYSKIVRELKEIRDNNSTFYVTIIGHTDRPTDDMNEKSVDSKTYANKIQNLFRYSLDTQTALERSREYAESLQERLVVDGVDENSTFVEFRGGEESSYYEGSNRERKLNNRVMVSVYVAYKELVDSDGDGVYDDVDLCPETPAGVSVDAKGCPLDSDLDGVPDYLDECPDTPVGVEVDARGCPLDSDSDGVADYKDKCPGTPIGIEVDAQGCPIYKTLRLNFKTDSAKIEAHAMPDVEEFAAFMQMSPHYKAKIIGHTDSIGKAAYNMQLSMKRSAALKDALVELGVDATRLETTGRGELEPLESNRTAEGRRINRRIEIKLSE